MAVKPALNTSAGLPGRGNEITDGNTFWKTTIVEMISCKDPSVPRVFMFPLQPEVPNSMVVTQGH